MSKELICYLVRTHLGPGFEALVSPLLDGDDLGLGELARLARIEPEEMRPMMIILLKRDILEAVDKGGQTLYRLGVENLFHLLLLPRYLGFIEDRFSLLARQMAETLSLGGRLTTEETLIATSELNGLERSLSTDPEAVTEFGQLASLGYFVPVHKALHQAEGENLFDPSSLTKRKPDKEKEKPSSKKPAKKGKANYLLEESLASGKLLDVYVILTQID